MNCIKLLTQAAQGHLGLHYAKKNERKRARMAILRWGSTLLSAPLTATQRSWQANKFRLTATLDTRRNTRAYLGIYN